MQSARERAPLSTKKPVRSLFAAGSYFPAIGMRAAFLDAHGQYGPAWGRVYGTLSGVNASHVTVQLACGKAVTLPRMWVFEPEANEQ